MENLTDRELLERNYHANEMLYQMVIQLRRDFRSSQQEFRMPRMMTGIKQDYKAMFEKDLDEYIAKQKQEPKESQES